jgi:hypothetical protein
VRGGRQPRGRARVSGPEVLIGQIAEGIGDKGRENRTPPLALRGKTGHLGGFISTSENAYSEYRSMRMRKKYACICLQGICLCGGGPKRVPVVLTKRRLSLYQGSASSFTDRLSTPRLVVAWLTRVCDEPITFTARTRRRSCERQTPWTHNKGRPCFKMERRLPFQAERDGDAHRCTEP